MENYDIEKIPLWSNDKPAFEVFADDVNGQISIIHFDD
jgi:hypothetical protein